MGRHSFLHLKVLIKPLNKLLGFFIHLTMISLMIILQRKRRVRYSQLPNRRTLPEHQRRSSFNRHVIIIIIVVETHLQHFLNRRNRRSVVVSAGGFGEDAVVLIALGVEMERVRRAVAAAELVLPRRHEVERRVVGSAAER